MADHVMGMRPRFGGGFGLPKHPESQSRHQHGQQRRACQKKKSLSGRFQEQVSLCRAAIRQDKNGRAVLGFMTLPCELSFSELGLIK